jgi:hypothetical protein
MAAQYSGAEIRKALQSCPSNPNNRNNSYPKIRFTTSGQSGKNHLCRLLLPNKVWPRCALLRQTYKLTKENNTPQTDHKQAGAASRTQNRTKTTAEGRSADFNPVYQNGRDPSA